MSPKLPVSINISGEVARPLVEAISETFSPISASMGWLGGLIDHQRLKSALRCFAEAKKIAKKEGIKLRPPPNKFLSSYIESCSLEDENDKDLIQWWARLLVDAGKKFEGTHLFFTSVLRQVTFTELELLECLVRNGKGSYKLKVAAEAEFIHDFNFDPSDINLAAKMDGPGIKQAIANIRSELGFPGTLILDLFIDDVKSRQIEEFHQDYRDGELPSWQMLQSLQLVRLEYVKFSKGQVTYRIRIALLTELGAKFYFACHEKGFGEKRSDRTRYKRKEP